MLKKLKTFQHQATILPLSNGTIDMIHLLQHQCSRVNLNKYTINTEITLQMPQIILMGQMGQMEHEYIKGLEIV